MRPLRVLMVDDSEDDFLLVRMMLEDAGYAVRALRVEDRHEMAEALAREGWDLVIIDFRLPHFSGPEAIVLLREIAPDAPILAMSGTDDRAHRETMRAGATAYLDKERIVEALADTVRSLVTPAPA